MEETQLLYENVTEKFIKKDREKSLQWVYNILEKKKESENIIYEEKGS